MNEQDQKQFETLKARVEALEIAVAALNDETDLPETAEKIEEELDAILKDLEAKDGAGSV